MSLSLFYSIPNYIARHLRIQSNKTRANAFEGWSTNRWNISAPRITAAAHMIRQTVLEASAENLLCVDKYVYSFMPAVYMMVLWMRKQPRTQGKVSV